MGGESDIKEREVDSVTARAPLENDIVTVRLPNEGKGSWGKGMYIPAAEVTRKNVTPLDL